MELWQYENGLSLLLQSRPHVLVPNDHSRHRSPHRARDKELSGLLEAVFGRFIKLRGLLTAKRSKGRIMD